MTVREYIGSVKRITGARERSMMEIQIKNVRNQILYQGKIDLIKTDLLEMECLKTIMVTNICLVVFVPFISREIRGLESI